MNGQPAGALRRALAIAALVTATALAAIAMPTTATPGGRSSGTEVENDAVRTDLQVREVTSPAPDRGSVEVLDVDPLVLAPGQDLTMRVRVTNTGTDPMSQPRVLVSMRRDGFVSRNSLDRWRDPDSGSSLGDLLAAVDLADPLAPGASRIVETTVPASQIALPTNSWSWGARGVSVQFIDAAAASNPLHLVRTFVIWFPDQKVDATSLSVLVPVVGPAPSDDPAAAVTTLTTEDGRLNHVLEATVHSPGVTWAVDPWLLSEAVTLSNSDTADDAAASTETESWSDRLLTGAQDREVALVPWADSDVSALVHANAVTLLDEAAERSADDAAALGLTATTELVLPADSLPDLEVAAYAARTAQPLVVGPGELLAPAVLTYTPSGRTAVSTANGEATVLVPDERLSSAFANGTVLPTGFAPTPITAAADLLAELAVITRERPVDPRHVLATVPRDWDPDVAVVQAQLDALSQAPFVMTGTLSDLATESATTVDRGSLPATMVDEGEVDAEILDAVDQTLRRRSALSTMASVPHLVLGDAQAERLAPAALAWRTDATGRAALVAQSVARTQELQNSVSVPGGSTVNLVSSSGELPIRVVNSLDQDVTLEVQLRPSDGRLVAQESVVLTVPADGEATATIAVHGVKTADVTAAVELYTPTGVLIDNSTSLKVRVRAEWESIGTGVVGVLLAIGLIAGLTRTIRRGGARARSELR